MILFLQTYRDHLRLLEPWTFHQHFLPTLMVPSKGSSPSPPWEDILKAPSRSSSENRALSYQANICSSPPAHHFCLPLQPSFGGENAAQCPDILGFSTAAVAAQYTPKHPGIPRPVVQLFQALPIPSKEHSLNPLAPWNVLTLEVYYGENPEGWGVTLRTDTHQCRNKTSTWNTHFWDPLLTQPTRQTHSRRAPWSPSQRKARGQKREQRQHQVLSWLFHQEGRGTAFVLRGPATQSGNFWVLSPGSARLLLLPLDAQKEQGLPLGPGQPPDAGERQRQRRHRCSSSQSTLYSPHSGQCLLVLSFYFPCPSFIPASSSHQDFLANWQGDSKGN